MEAILPPRWGRMVTVQFPARRRILPSPTSILFASAIFLSSCDFRADAQPPGRGLGGDVSLRHAQHLKAHHELAHRGRAPQRWIEVGVEVPLRMRVRIGWRLVA